MYNKTWLEKIDAERQTYFAVICGKISVCFFTETEASQYRNKYGDLYNTRRDANVALAGGYKFGVAPKEVIA